MKKNKGSLKKVTRLLHLWLGLLSGLIVLVISITGCLYVFNKEITHFTEKDLLYLKKDFGNSAPELLPISKLRELAEEKLHTKVYSAITYNDPAKSWEFMAFETGDKEAFWFFDTIEKYESVFINPYTGEIKGIKDYKKDFFVIVKYLHWSLLLNTRYGQPIVGYATLIFVILLITGLILWWPKKLNRVNLNRSFKIGWKASFKRLNYDLHNVPGFYSLLVALVLALTGLTWAFQWFQRTVYVAASWSTEPPKRVELQSDSSQRSASNPLDIAFSEVKKTIVASRIVVSPAKSPAGIISVTAYYDKENYYDADVFQFDQFTGKYLNRENFEDKNNGEKILRMNYDIHVGAIAGLPGKIIVFLASFISASLPVTGLMIYLGKRKKKNRLSRNIERYTRRHSRQKENRLNDK